MATKIYRFARARGSSIESRVSELGLLMSCMYTAEDEYNIFFNKHDMVKLCWFGVGPPSVTAGPTTNKTQYLVLVGLPVAMCANENLGLL